MSKKSPNKVLSVQKPEKEFNSFEPLIKYVLLFILDVFILFTTRIPLHFFRWVVTMVVRGYIFYFVFFIYNGNMFSLSVNSYDISSKAIFHDLFVIIPIVIFQLWYFITTFVMFLAPFYSGNSFSVNSSDDFSEINRFINWRNNKMKFSSYKENTQLMRDSAILNNLDQNDPEARKTLNYINNKMRFMSYQESIEFLKGK